MFSALRPNTSRSSAAGPDLPNVSITATGTTLQGASSEVTSVTALKRPPITLCSSQVTIRSVSLAA